MLDVPSRTLELSRLRHRGIAVTLHHPKLFVEHFKLLWGLQVLYPKAQRELVQHLGLGRIEAACAILLRRTSFRRKATWSLFWSLTHASMEIADSGLTATHEPELNGTFMSLIAKAIASFPQSSGSNVALVIADHATLGNEARTGADFGLILEVEHRGEVRHLVTLLQAKRATSKRLNVTRAAGDSTQLDRLVSSGIGSYLFYHAHSDPIGLGPTVRDADAISKSNPASVDVLSPADDFAVRLAVGADNMFTGAVPYALPGMCAAGGRGDALRMLFNPNVDGLKVNGVVVARVGAHGLSPRGVVDFENEWRALVESHREEVDRLQEGAWTTGEEREPPLIHI